MCARSKYQGGSLDYELHMRYEWPAMQLVQEHLNAEFKDANELRIYAIGISYLASALSSPNNQSKKFISQQQYWCAN